jgi:predicted ArsR family transcriptional regulator
MKRRGRKPSISDKQIVAKLRQKPGKIARELGVAAPRMYRLEAEGLVARVGERRSGRRGRPAIEWQAA